jgi:hypothetical protein
MLDVSLFACSAYVSILKEEVIRSSETSENGYQTALHHIPHDCSPNIPSLIRENFRFHINLETFVTAVDYICCFGHC